MLDDNIFENGNTAYEVFYRVERLHFKKSFKLLDTTNSKIYPGKTRLLAILKESENISQKELAQKLGVKPATITVVLKRMEESGIVIKVQDKQDKRVTRVKLTQVGNKMFRISSRKVKELNKKCFFNFTKEEQEELNRLLLKMEKNLENM